jgi:DNA-binding response OmpR family regulator
MIPCGPPLESKPSPQPVSINQRYLHRPGHAWGDGLLVLERLKTNRLLSHIPVVVVTVRDRKGPEDQTRRLGAIDYVSKPTQADALMASFRTILAMSDRPPEGGTLETA